MINLFSNLSQATHEVVNHASSVNQLNVFINILILLAIAIGTPSLVIIVLSFFKFKITRVVRIYLYSFVAGIVLILGTVGFISEAISHSKEYFTNLSEQIASGTHHHDLKAVDILQIVGVVGGGCIIGLGGVLTMRYFISHSHKELHEHHHMHDHNDQWYNSSDIDNVKVKWLPIILLMLHRCVDGITLGFMANTSNGQIAQFDNWGMIIIFAIHLIPTTIIIYLIQLDIQQGKRLKALLITLGINLAMIPFTLIGGFLITNIQSIWWLLPLLFSISGSVLVVMSILELIPEFIHYRNSKTKIWFGSIGLFIFGLLLAVILLCIH